jgi:hypothetical protein
MFVPDSDRRHCSQSGRVINQKNAFVWNDNVVSEFVLGDNLGNDVRVKLLFRF